MTANNETTASMAFFQYTGPASSTFSRIALITAVTSMGDCTRTPNGAPFQYHCHVGYKASCCRRDGGGNSSGSIGTVPFPRLAVAAVCLHGYTTKRLCLLFSCITVAREIDSCVFPEAWTLDCCGKAIDPDVTRYLEDVEDHLNLFLEEAGPTPRLFLKTA